jgi:hypothetical protein
MTSHKTRSSAHVSRPQVSSTSPTAVQRTRVSQPRIAMVTLASLVLLLGLWLQQCWAQNRSCSAVTQHLTEPPYDNFFYSDCNSDTQVVVTSPLPDSNLSIIGPRLIVAWPAGASGVCAFFQPQNGPNGSLAIELVNSTLGAPLGPVYRTTQASETPFVGVQGVLAFNSSATLTVPILGSIRTIRDFTEGPSLLRPIIQDAINVTRSNGTGATISRLCKYNRSRPALPDFSRISMGD